MAGNPVVWPWLFQTSNLKIDLSFSSHYSDSMSLETTSFKGWMSLFWLHFPLYP